MALRRMVSQLSSKCAIGTPMIGRAGTLDPPQPWASIAIIRAATPANREVSTAIGSPSHPCAAMTIAIGHHGRHDDAAFHDVLNVRVEADERKSARHDAENDRADHSARN